MASPPTAPLADDPFARKLRGFGPTGSLAALIVLAVGPLFEPFGVIPALLWTRRSRTPWRELGFVRPANLALTLAGGLTLGIALKLLMKAVVMPILGAPVINQEYHYLAGNDLATLNMLFDATLGAGFGEETVFRGFLFERLGKLFGSGAPAKAAIVLGTSVLFGAIHYPLHGLGSAEQATMVGLVLGTVFALTGRIWSVILAHAAFDVTAVLIIYFNLEAEVAHLVFR